MTKIAIISGFLGAGKTTLIKKLIREAYAGEQLVLIENEFGEIAIDGGFLQDAGIRITEMNSGCICCSLVGDFAKALSEVLDRFSPHRILIEPSGVGKLSDVIRAVQGLRRDDVTLSAFTTVADAGKCRMYLKNFGEFYIDQIAHAGCIVLSRTGSLSEEAVEQAVALLREHNKTATIITTPWDKLTGEQISLAMEREDTLACALTALREEAHGDGRELHHEHEHEQEHHHDHEQEHHHADEVFSSWGIETAHRFSRAGLQKSLSALENSALYGEVLRAKGIVEGENGVWLHFDYVPGEQEIREGVAAVTGRLCVIGSHLAEDALQTLFDREGDNR